MAFRHLHLLNAAGLLTRLRSYTPAVADTLKGHLQGHRVSDPWKAGRNG
jgi:hypothetical protein